MKGSQKKAKISVIMPAYKAEKFIATAIQSVLSQEDANFELLIGDDASKDGTFKIIKKFESDPRVKIFSSKKNLGAAKLRNFLISKAQGIYLTPCDADDILLPGNLTRLSSILDQEPKIGLVYADCLVLELDKKGTMVKAPYLLGSNCNDTWDLASKTANHGGCMIRTKHVRKVGGYDETVFSVDDFSLMVKLREVTEFCYLPGEFYYVWKRHPASMTRTDKNAQRDMISIIEKAAVRRFGATGGELRR